MTDEFDPQDIHEPLHVLRWEHVGMRIPGEVIRLDLYRLICYFQTSEYLSNLTDMGDFCPWQSLRDDFEAAEIVRILLQTAVMIRFIAFGHADEQRSQKEAMDGEVGKLFVKSAESAQQPLSLREACNKIIHARNIVLDDNGGEHTYNTFIKPRVFCHENFEKKTGWRAELDVVRFVEICSQLATSFS